jgi:dCTP deaminase
MAIEHQMIHPFEPGQVREGVISFGVSSYGYDFRLGDEFRIFCAGNEKSIDPKRFREDAFVSFRGDVCEIPPHSFVLALTVEYFRIPRNVLTICYGKSTYARCGVIINVTPFEPEWEGHATLAISNTGPLPVRIYANEGIGQLIFLESDEVCESSYSDKKGKYQAQKGITPAKI